MNSQKKIILAGKAITVYLDDKKTFPISYGKIGIDAVKKRENIIYRSWSIELNQSIDAEEKDNAGLDEVQIMFNMNQDINWVIKNKKSMSSDILKTNTTIAEPEKVDMVPGEVCIFRNNNYCTAINYEAGKNFKFKSMQMSTLFFRDLLSKYFTDKNIRDLETQLLTRVTKTSITPEMYRVLSEIDTSEKYKEYEGVYLEGKMIELTALVLYGIAYRKNGEIKRRAMPNKNDVEKIEFIREQIQRKPSEEYDAESVAESLGMSVSKLNRLFRFIYDTSLHSYVQEKRLEYAAHLIGEHDIAISEAAQKAGYSNMSHFSKSFEKRYGILPKDFSKSEKNKA
ncbi:MAG: AraC family transcriptional regulator [Treponema sp.]|nr:AraC family transcriptional regulator [Treponema sp.]